MLDYKKVFRNRERRLKIISLLRWMPDKPYIKMVYRIKTGEKLNLKQPVGFNEKLNWLKLHDIRPEYTDYVDKLKVREIIKKKIGEEYLIPLLGAWDSFDKIDFESLPDQFVLKCNHDSGSVKIIDDKAHINKEELSKFFHDRLKMNPYWLGREYPYNTVSPKIIAEKYMIDSRDTSGELKDYKFFCFNGVPKYLYLSEGLSNHDTARISYVTMDWKKAPFQRTDFLQFDVLPDRPKNFDKMVALCHILAENIPMVRIDLYEINDVVYFGEYTFFPSGGYVLNHPKEWERKIGDMLRLPTDIK